MLAKDLVLIAFGLVTISLVPINTEISSDHMLLMGTALAVAVVVPYLVSRFGYRDHAVRFPIRGGHRWTTLEKWYLVAVLVLGWTILPVYMIRSGVYLSPDSPISVGVGRVVARECPCGTAGLDLSRV